MRVNLSLKNWIMFWFEFLSQVALVSDIDGMENIFKQCYVNDIALGKGLEFPIVFLAGLEEGIFSSPKNVYTSASELEEERRLMYVGVTRAEEILYIKHAKRRQVWGEFKYFNPSRFLDEIPSDLLILLILIAFSSQATLECAVDKIKTATVQSGTCQKLLRINSVMSRRQTGSGKTLWHREKNLLPELSSFQIRGQKLCQQDYN